MMREHKIGDFLKRVKNQVNIEDSKLYKRITIRTNHQGVKLRNETLGAEIGTKKQFLVNGGDFILSKIDARYGAFGIIPEELDGAIITGNFWTYKVNTEIVDTEWFFYFTHSYDFLQICKESSTGTTHRKYLNEKIFLNHKIKLPEKDIQVKMVKIYKDGAKRVETLENEIQSQKSLLTQLKQSILQEAIQGKLTRDWRARHPELVSGSNSAAALLENIKTEKARLVKEKKIKKEKPLPPITEDEIPFELPEGWVWYRLGEVLEVVRGSSPRPKGDPRYWSKKRTQFHWITIADFKPYIKNNILTDTSGFLTKEGSTHSRKVGKGDLIIACSGVGSVGKSVKLGIDGFIYDGLLGIRDIPKELETDFVALFIKYKELKIYSLATGANWLNINTDLVKNYVVPLPPIEEQKAIVQKVRTLMEKCDVLEQQITQSETHAQMLMQAVLKEAFEEKEKQVVQVIN